MVILAFNNRPVDLTFIFIIPSNSFFDPKIFKFTFNVSESDADTIETFLDARGATESFDYTPENDTARKFVCESWSKTIPYLNRATIQATFREVFEP